MANGNNRGGQARHKHGGQARHKHGGQVSAPWGFQCFLRYPAACGGGVHSKRIIYFVTIMPKSTINFLKCREPGPQRGRSDIGAYESSFSTVILASLFLLLDQLC